MRCILPISLGRALASVSPPFRLGFAHFCLLLFICLIAFPPRTQQNCSQLTPFAKYSLYIEEQSQSIISPFEGRFILYLVIISVCWMAVKEHDWIWQVMMVVISIYDHGPISRPRILHCKWIYIIAWCSAFIALESVCTMFLVFAPSRPGKLAKK